MNEIIFNQKSKYKLKNKLYQQIVYYSPRKDFELSLLTLKYSSAWAYQLKTNLYHKQHLLFFHSRKKCVQNFSQVKLGW